MAVSGLQCIFLYYIRYFYIILYQPDSYSLSDSQHILTPNLSSVNSAITICNTRLYVLILS